VAARPHPEFEFSIARAFRSRRKNAGAEPVAAPARVRVANPRQGDFAKPDCVVAIASVRQNSPAHNGIP
jgi:hypothetical protein